MALPLSAYRLLQIQVEALFCSTAEGRLCCNNEPGEPLAPRFFMGRTAEGNLWRYRDDLPAALLREVDACCRAEPVSRDLAERPVHYEAIRAALARHAPIRSEQRGPAYWCPPPAQLPGEVVLIGPTNAHMLQGSFAGVLPYMHGGAPVVAIVIDGRVASLCWCARITRRAAEAGVETVPGYRGLGLATRAATGWVAAIYQRGLLPLYSTSWENLASQGVARHLGAVLYAENWSIS